jgi:tRNA-dihydrouridine synthase B
VFTEMVSARAVIELERRGSRQADRLWGLADEARPLGVQIWDNDPGTLAAVARRLVDRFAPSVIDLNFGCPAPEVTEKAGSGAHLLDKPERIERIVARVADACRPVPVTAKIRLGPDAGRITAPEVAEAVERAGGAALTVHGRTAAQHYRGRADWERIAELKGHLRRIPLIGNGDLRSPEAVTDTLRTYPVHGVMLGRAPLGRPWIFRQAAALLRGEPCPPEPAPDEQAELVREHFRLVVQQHGPKKGPVLMRRFAAQYGQGMPGARHFRAAVAEVGTVAEFEAVVRRHFDDCPSSNSQRPEQP